MSEDCIAREFRQRPIFGETRAQISKRPHALVDKRRMPCDGPRAIPPVWRKRGYGWRGLSCAVLMVHVLLLAYGAATAAPTYDEPGHMVAGLSYYQFRRMDLYNVNPPLVRLVAALPVWLASPKMHWAGWDPDLGGRQEFALGQQFIALNRERSMAYFTMARWACIPFSVAGALVCRRWSRELYGEMPGFLTLCLWCFSPGILGHGQLITPDVAAAATGILSLYTFRRWQCRRSILDAMVAGIILGLAIGTKTTWVLLLALYPMAWSIGRLAGALNHSTSDRQPGTAPRASVPKDLWQLTLLIAIGLYSLNALYVFDGTFRRLDSYEFYSRSLSGQAREVDAIQSGNRFRDSFVGKLPLPFPKDLVIGADVQKLDFDRKKPAYLGGTWQKGGWWYYYLYALAVKTPVGTLVIMGLSALTFMRLRPSADEWFLLLTAAMLVTLISSQTGINKHMRYLFPAFPMLFILASRCAASSMSHWLIKIATVCTAATAIASLSVYPYSISFFNIAAGGPGRGAAHLLNSNISWGQDIVRLVEWTQLHPSRRPLYAALHASYEPADVGLDYSVPSQGLLQQGGASWSEPPVGWYAIDVSFLYGYAHRVPLGNGIRQQVNPDFWSGFRSRKPEGRIGYSIYLFHVSK